MESSSLGQVHTFLIADIRGYTRYTVEQGDEAAAKLAAAFAGRVDEIASRRGGRLIEVRGDETLVVFTSPREALRASVELQDALRPVFEGTGTGAGMGIDSGEAIAVGDGYRGAALNLAARLCSVAGAGQVLVTEGSLHLVRRTPGITFDDHGPMTFKGFEDPVRVFAVKREEALPPVESAGVEPQPAATGGFLGAAPESTLVAREVELSQAYSCIREALNRHGRVVMINGEPGVGKTRLAQEIGLRATEFGFLVAAGRCYAAHSGVPFFPFREALAAMYRDVGPDIRSAIPRNWPHLARLLPDHPIPEPPPASSSQEEMLRLFGAVTGFIQAASELAPLAIMVDDLHWADASTIELMEHIARHSHGSAVIVIGTFRETEIDQTHPLRRALLDLAREHLVERISLTALSTEETARQIETLSEVGVAGELAEFIQARTAGNPLFTQELFRTMREGGDIIDSGGTWHLGVPRADPAFPHAPRVPETIRLVIEQRLSRLSTPTRDLLTEASVLGQSFQFDDLADLSGLPEDELDEALSEAAASGLVREAGDDDYVFNHSLTQQALYGQLSPRKLRRMHHAIAGSIQAKGAGETVKRAAELSAHLAEAGEHGDAACYALSAGDQAEALWSHHVAEVHYRAALHLVAQLNDPARTAEVQERIGGLYTAMIRYPEALDMLEAAVLSHQLSRDSAGEYRVIAQIGRVLIAAGETERGIQRLESALAVGSGADPASRAAVQSSLARLLFAAGRYEAAHRIAEEAAANTDDTGVGGESRVTAAAALPLMGDIEAGHEQLRAEASAAAQRGDLFSSCRASQHLGIIAVTQGDFAGSRRWFSEALELARRMDNQRQIANGLYGLAVVSWLDGSGDGTEDADAALGIMQRLGGSWMKVFTWSGLDERLSGEQLSTAPETIRRLLELAEPAIG